MFLVTHVTEARVRWVVRARCGAVTVGCVSVAAGTTGDEPDKARRRRAASVALSGGEVVDIQPAPPRRHCRPAARPQEPPKPPLRHPVFRASAYRAPDAGSHMEHQLRVLYTFTYRRG